MGHPFGAERPYSPPKTAKERKREKDELAAQKAIRDTALLNESRRKNRISLRKAVKRGEIPPTSFADFPKPPTAKQ